MKNIHVLQTDKPSRLACDFDKLILNSRLLSPILYKTQNIYITSDEEIKEGDWYINNGNLLKCTEVKKRSSCKKIILTTDQDLIKDGVQAIDDEFLEWFVKNPSCEVVEVFKERHHGVEFINDYPKGFFDYKIIIPQEEPKQETLEEAAGNLADPNICKTDNWIAGANYQAERMYSEEELLQALNIGFTSTDETWEECIAFAKEQFKNK
jgi:hypothetical protein